MPKTAFGVYNTMAGETVAEIWMDTELVKDATIVDPERLTLSPIANGSVYTLLPLEDGRLNALKALRHAYLAATQRPASFFSTSIGRMDQLIKAVGNVFDDVDYIHVRNRDDLNAIINPKDEYEFETVKISVLGEIAEQIKEEDDELLAKWKKELEQGEVHYGD